MIKITKFFYINALILPLFVVACFTKSVNTLLLAYSVATVHEFFHLFAALLLSVKVKSIIVMPFGLTLRLGDAVIKSPTKEVCISLAGPFANVLMIGLAWALEKLCIWGGASLFLFIYLNVIMFFLNLFPCMPLDGGRVLKAILVGKVGYLNAVSVMKKAQKIIIFALLLFGTLILCITKFNASLVMIAAFLAFNMAGEEDKKNYILMRELVHFKDKLKERKFIKTKLITIREDIKAGELLKRFSYDCFYIVNVEKKDLKRNVLITEADVVYALEKYGFSLTISDVANLGFDNRVNWKV